LVQTYVSLIEKVLSTQRQITTVIGLTEITFNKSNRFLKQQNLSKNSLLQ
jgi:hypothetical protein